MKQLLALLIALLLLSAAGCGTKEPPKTDPTPEPREPEQAVLPEDFPMTLHFSSGAGGWQTELTLQRDGAFAGQYHDSDMGSTGTDYPGGTVYLCEFEGRFGNFQTVDDTTLSLTLEELTALTKEDEIWTEDGVRFIGATPYGLKNGTDFLLYLPETPVSVLTDSGRSGWPLAETGSDTLNCYGLHNPALDATFFDWTYWFPEGEPAATAPEETGHEPGVEKNGEPAEEPAQDEAAPPAMAVHEIEGIRIRLPMEHLPKLLVTTLSDYCAEELDSHDLPLLSVREKASVEAGEADYGDGSGFGFLFGISRLDQVGFEALVQYDIPGCEVFATDGTYYYAVTYPTDVQFYRSGDAFHDEAQQAEWAVLYELAEAVPADILEQNGLTPYSQRDLYAQAFTYKGNHVYVNYYPYFTVDGSHDNFYTLVLSQPVTQGAGGIWCVERMVDAHGNTYLIFPQENVPAMEYYTARQTDHDSGAEAVLLTPLGAAEDFLRHGGWFSGELAQGSLEETTSMDEGYLEANRLLDRVLPGLLTGRTVAEEELLACLAAFREDTWAFMGRSYYGSDWWPPLLSAVEGIAAGEGRQERCAALQNFYLTSYGRYEEALRPLLLAQFESAPEASNEALKTLSVEEQALLTGILGG